MQLNKDILRERRLDLGWTQQQLADACGISLRTIQRVEKDGAACLDTTAALGVVFEMKRSALLYASPTQDVIKPNYKILIGASALIGFVLGVVLTMMVT